MTAGVRHVRGEHGQSMLWTAVLLSFLLLPLAAAVADGGRLLVVRNRLQTAVDAACADAAWSAADYAAFRATGVTTFQRSWYWIGRAQSTFHQMLADQKTVAYDAWVHIVADAGQAAMQCSALARVPLLTAGGLVASPVEIRAASTARIRFRKDAAP